MKGIHYIIIVSIILLVSFSSYKLGMNSEYDSRQASLDAVQSMLAFNHLLQYEELYDCLSTGNTEQVLRKLEMAIISEKELISNFLKWNNNPMVNDYITIRYPQGIESLKNFKSNRESN